DFGVFSASAAGGRNPLGSGGRVSLGFDRQSPGLSFSVQGAWASPHFRLVGDTDSQLVVERQLLASAGYTFGRYGTLSVAYVARSYHRNLPLGEGFGYRLRASDQGPRQAEIDYQNRYGTYSAEVAQAQGQTGERVSASGGVGFIGGNMFLSRTINDSFGLVRLPGY